MKGSAYFIQRYPSYSPLKGEKPTRTALKLFLFALLLLPTLSPAQTFHIQHNGLQREYIIHLPTSFTAADTLPLVFCLHGLLQSNRRIEEVAEMDTIADREKFIMCYPLGVDTQWNSFGNPHTGTDDVGFFSSLIDTLDAQYHINLDRVYALGMSNGGFMCYSLACMLSDRIAAIASIAGSTTDSIITYCQATRPVPIMEIHGDADWLVNYNGGFVGLSLANNSIDSTMHYWVIQNSCTTLPDSTQLPDIDNTDNCTVTKIHWAQCNESELIHYRVNNGGHTWPGSAVDFDGLGGNVNHDFEATEKIWEFFSRYSLQGKIETAVKEFSTPQIHLYPTPVADDLVIELGDFAASKISVTDLSGRVLKTVQVNAHERNSISLSFEAFPAGMYLITLEGNTGVVSRKVLHQ